MFAEKIFVSIKELQSKHNLNYNIIKAIIELKYKDFFIVDFLNNFLLYRMHEEMSSENWWLYWY